VPEWSALAPFAALGLLGSLHCAGMCGPFALALGLRAGRARGRALAHALLYAVAKALGYALLGLLAARAAHAAVHATSALGAGAGQELRLESLRAALAWAAAAACLVLALSALGLPLVPPSWRARLARHGAVPRALATLFAAAHALPGTAQAFALGFANAFLPCGLSWAALALALAVPSATATVGLFLFGLGTLPVLVGVALGGRLLTPGLRARLRVPAALLLIVFAVLTAARGGPAGAREVLPSCCAGPSGR
jgi:sulfite exporter TauE/SafE